MKCDDFDVCLQEANKVLEMVEMFSEWEDTPEEKIYHLATFASGASEFYMKAIMIFRSPTGEFERSVDPLYLFNKLSQSDRIAIKESFEKEVNSDLMESLKKTRYTIDEWQAFSEKDAHIHIERMIKLGRVLQRYVIGLS